MEGNMKRFWLIVLSLGLVMAFSMSAFAVDVKVGAEYYAGGLYLNKTTVNDGRADGYHPYEEPSTAFFFQRLRVGTDFIVSPSLKLVTRFDAMERIWGGARTSPLSYDVWRDSWWSSGTRAENENIALDVVYVDYNSPVGEFKIGYMPDYDWGTIFSNSSERNTGQIRYAWSKGPFTVLAIYSKEYEQNYNYLTSSYNEDTDVDSDSYRIGGIYKFNTGKAAGEAGIEFEYIRDATSKASGPPDTYMAYIYDITPYFKAKIGPVDVQGELVYMFGNDRKYEDNLPYTDVSISAINLFLDATANLGMFYVGGSFAYLSGDDPSTQDKLEGYANAGLDWNPCLIMFNTQTLYWVGPIMGHSSSVVNYPMSNAWFFQGRVGVKPTPQWDIFLSLSWAQADKKPDLRDSGTTFPNSNYGTEIDLVGTYKITNNLSYMLGAGYLFTGDYFKGYDWPNQGIKIQDDFMLINKLTLSF